jgi:hypothetical protein
MIGEGKWGKEGKRIMGDSIRVSLFFDANIHVDALPLLFDFEFKCTGKAKRNEQEIERRRA